MGDDYLFCNYKNCTSLLTKVAWITRCSHVFCEEHGNSFFHTRALKVKCPACNEMNCRETDVIKTNLNPHDMLISCLRPEKALEYVCNATKLWSYQMKQKRKLSIEHLSEKYEQIATEALMKLKNENSELKRFLIEIDQKLKTVTEELNLTKHRLRKYQMKYENLHSKNQKHNTSRYETSFFKEFNEDPFNDTCSLGSRLPFNRSFENITDYQF